jgi:hypothetical protein
VDRERIRISGHASITTRTARRVLRTPDAAGARLGPDVHVRWNERNGRNRRINALLDGRSLCRLGDLRSRFFARYVGVSRFDAAGTASVTLTSYRRRLVTRRCCMSSEFGLLDR